MSLLLAVFASSPSVSSDTRTVYVIEGKTKVAVLHACPNERFFPGTSDSGTAPSLSPNGEWLIVIRAFPFEMKGRIDESSVLVDLTTGRSFSTMFLGQKFGTGYPFVLKWVSGEPATLRIDGDAGVRDLRLPESLKDVQPPDRCALAK